MTFRGNQAAQEAITETAPCACGASDVVKVFAFRRGAGSFFDELPRVIKVLNVKEILSQSQSESDGMISIVVLYK